MAQISVNKNIVIYIAKCLTEMDMIIILSSQSRSVHPVENNATCHEHPLQSSQWTLQPTVQCPQSMFYKKKRAMEYITHLRNISQQNTSLSKDMIIQEGWVKSQLSPLKRRVGFHQNILESPLYLKFGGGGGGGGVGFYPFSPKVNTSPTTIFVELMQIHCM